MSIKHISFPQNISNCDFAHIVIPFFEASAQQLKAYYIHNKGNNKITDHYVSIYTLELVQFT